MKNNAIMLNEKFVYDFIRLRFELLEELGEIHEESDHSYISELKSATAEYYLSHINKDLFTFGIFQGERLASAGSLCLFTRIPYKRNLNGSEGYILNIYTSAEFRGRGFASQILKSIVKYSKENDIKRLWLDSSEQGRALYSKHGFSERHDVMELFLTPLT